MLNKIIYLMSWLVGFISVYLGYQNTFSNEATILFIVAAGGIFYHNSREKYA